MRVLGIDPGIGRMGWGIIDIEKGKATAYKFGCFETDSKTETATRLCEIFDFITTTIEKHKPSLIAIEDLFFSKNSKTAFIVGQARGVILLAAGQKKLDIHIYTPLQVKTAVAGYGRAEKEQVGKMVKAILKLPEVPRPDDTADALAIALTCGFSRR
jgi:crossover junction endodeoxyribonuclease RuvC